VSEESSQPLVASVTIKAGSVDAGLAFFVSPPSNAGNRGGGAGHALSLNDLLAGDSAILRISDAPIRVNRYHASIIMFIAIFFSNTYCISDSQRGGAYDAHSEPRLPKHFAKRSH